MWNKPWSYKEGLAIGAGLLVIGLLLQVTVGAIHWDLFAWPVNFITLIAYIAALVAMHLLRKRIYFFGWCSHLLSAVSSLVWVVGITVVMGLIRQAPSGHESDAFPGFSQMITSWSFVLLYLWMTTSLGLTILRVAFPLRLNKLSFLITHIGLFLVLITATLGNADLQRLKMTTRIGATEWRATTETGEVVELPLAIELLDFNIDEYPPKLMMIDNETGHALPKNSPEQVLLEEGVKHGKLLDWSLTIQQNLPMAASYTTADSTKFTAFYSVGATCAIYLKAINKKKNTEREGWVSCGSFLFPYRAIRLDSLTSIVMPEREPRRFASDVKIYTKSGKALKGTIEVNRPMEVQGWKIYQLSYDETKGRWSDIRVFELVRDPWLTIVYIGIGLMVIGAILLFVTAQKSKKEKYV